MKFLALDGNSLAYRAFFALPDTMTTLDGQVTNAVFGFCSMFANLMKDHSPDGVVVVFDRKEKTFRHERAPEYKAQREKQPDSLYSQLDVIKEVLTAAGITVVDKAGFEGDDIIATVAQQLATGDELIIVTGDRDAYQLVQDPQVRVLYNKRGVSDYALYDEAGIKERTGVQPSQYAEYAALRGDPSDNLDGVPGVGEKTAAKLINTYGSLQSIFDHAAEQTPKLAKALEESQERVMRNAELMKLVQDVPIEVSLADCIPRPDAAALRGLFERLEFSSMLARWRPFLDRFGRSETLSETSTVVGRAEPANVLDVSMYDLSSVAEVSELLRDRSTSLGLAAAWAGERGRSELLAVLVSQGKFDEDGRVQCGVLGAKLLGENAVASLVSTAPHLVLHDGRNMMRGLLRLGIDIKRPRFDSAIAAYLVEAESGSYDAGSVARRWLKKKLVAHTGVADGELDFEASPSDASFRDAAIESAVAVLSEVPLRGALAEEKLDSLYGDTELPLVRVLAKMEHAGIAVDRTRLTALEAELQKKSSALVSTLHRLVGREFNVNSTKQLTQILYEERGLTGGKKTKTKKYSTDAATLEKIRDEWPEFIDALLEYRETEKLRATYAVGLLAAIEADGRIHASFNQTVARTGRLSSDQPNLHNIPVRTEAGRVFREVFVPKKDHVFLVADYNQIELRCIAHLARDPGLLSAFNSGLDIHRATAAQVFGVALDAVTIDQRSKAKMVSYGLAYGMEAYGLAQRLAIDVGEAKQILDAYFSAFPRVKQYMEDTVAAARSSGYTTTLFGRRRHIEGFGGARNVDAAAARMAMNAGIQGLAADIFKIALVSTDRLLEDEGLRSRIILQVHDEIIVEVPGDERERVGPMIIGAMEAAATLDVPLVVNASWGSSWAGAKVA
jgi:DNA polymerase-1